MTKETIGTIGTKGYLYNVSLIKYLLSLLSLLFLSSLSPLLPFPLNAYERNPQVHPAVWDSLVPYFLPENHPIKAKLDKFFSKARSIKDVNSMKAAGFIKPIPRKYTRLVVTKHPKFKGYIFKLYLDSQHYHGKKPEHYYWMLRIEGVNLIRNEIALRGLGGIYKAPKKWIYPLPENPSPPKNYLRKNFILIEEDMDILDDRANELRWGSSVVTANFLKTFFRFVSDLGLWDCAKPANAPFGRDGRIAFIDTQSFHRWPVKYEKLTTFLSMEMQIYWNELIDGKN